RRMGQRLQHLRRGRTLRRRQGVGRRPRARGRRARSVHRAQDRARGPRVVAAGFDVARVRRETPGCAEVHHFNNAGAALPSEPVVRAQVEHLELEARIGGYEAARVAAPRVERTYAALAELLNAQPSEIALLENATRAWDMAFYSIPLSPVDRILTS